VASGQNGAPATQPARLLLVDDDPRAAAVIAEMLRGIWPEGLVVAHAQRLGDVERELLDHGATCVLLDLSQHQDDRLAALRHVRAAGPDVPIIVLSDHAGGEAGLWAVQDGAQDYLLKRELDRSLLSRAIRHAIERKRSEVELAHQALHDPLTGLPNRVLFLDRLGVALDRSRRTDSSVAVLFLDVDKFKLINDSRGHAAGDQLLVGLAGRLQEMLRPMDTMARLGGDEFTFLVEDLRSEREAILVAERLSHTAGLPIKIGSGETAITVSIGIALADGPSAAPEKVIGDADTAMYRAKRQGGSRFELFDESSRQRATERMALERALGRAVERAELRVHYQPRVSLTGETRLIGFEALLRWEHPQRGLITPAEFIAVAEDTGLILPIGEFVLEQALRDLERWRRSRPGMTISVNLSSRQLAQPGLIERLADAVAATGADPGNLCLEVTETTLELSPEPSVRILKALSELGFKLAIDDFGTGYSSLSRLKQLPVDTLKIHESFVTDLGRRPGEAAIVGAVVELGHALELSVVAEGVETDAQLAQLRDVGCDGAQGFLFGSPVTKAKIDALLEASAG
jgi:diguanylate cyclase (GGDEF)-like protein